MDVVGIVVSLAHLVWYRDTYFTNHKHFRESVGPYSTQLSLLSEKKKDTVVRRLFRNSTTTDRLFLSPQLLLYTYRPYDKGCNLDELYLVYFNINWKSTVSEW